MLHQIDHNYTVGVVYVYICIECQSSILSHMVPESVSNLICWNCKGCIEKSIDPVQYRFTIPSLLAQCHVAGSMPRCWLIFFWPTPQKKTRKNWKNWASYMPLSQLGVPSSSRPIHTWAFQLLKSISRFAQSGVSSNLWSYRAFPQKVRRGMSWLCFPSAWPSSHCLIARSQNYTNLQDSWICGRLRVFASVLRIFAGVLLCIYMRWCSGYENGLVLVCPWDAARMQAMFNNIQKVNCGDSVATRKQNQAN